MWIRAFGFKADGLQPPLTTVQQAVLLVLLVLPGITYQYLRERWRGPIAAEQQFAERIMRAIVASMALDATYAVVVGPELAGIFSSGGRFDSTLVVRNLRSTGIWALVLLIAVPALCAALVSGMQRLRATAAYRRAPTAWDHLFGGRGQGGACYVRARLKDGTWVGGWYGNRSYSSSFPHSSDLFLQWAYEMDEKGVFGRPVQGTAGLYLRAEDIDVLELVEALAVSELQPEATNE